MSSFRVRVLSGASSVSQIKLILLRSTGPTQIRHDRNCTNVSGRRELWAGLKLPRRGRPTRAGDIGLAASDDEAEASWQGAFRAFGVSDRSASDEAFRVAERLPQLRCAVQAVFRFNGRLIEIP